MAWSQPIFCHSPLTSFIGYFRRRSPCTSSRTDAPLAQCDPRLSGLSHAGSWPTQTPFWTSAITVQPTEQCVQMFFLISVGAPTISGPAQERAAVEHTRGETGGDTLQTRPARGSISSLHQHVRGPINSG